MARKTDVQGYRDPRWLAFKRQRLHEIVVVEGAGEALDLDRARPTVLAVCRQVEVTVATSLMIARPRLRIPDERDRPF